jgi:putative endonuclease
MKNCFVYIITNRPQGTIYIGVTNDLERRICEHKNRIYPGFSKKYNLTNLVYFAEFGDVNEAIACEKK